MKKHIASILALLSLSFLMLFSAVFLLLPKNSQALQPYEVTNPVTQSATIVDNVVYTLNEQGTAYTASQNATSYGNLVLQSKIDGIPVTTIGSFSHAIFTSLTIPDSITSIKYRAFYNATIKSDLIIPKSVTTIESYAFEGSIISALTFESGSQLTTIAFRAFYLAKIYSELIISNSVTTIESNAFENSTISALTFEPGSQLTTIAYKAFYFVKINSELIIPKSVTTIETYAFHMSTIEAFTFEPGSQLTTIASYTFYSATINAELIIPANMTEIGSYAFAYSNIAKISFGPGSQLTTIAYRAFYIAKINSELIIPKSVTTIESNAFESSTISALTFESGTQLTTIASYTFYYATINAELIIPASVTLVGSYAFAYSNIAKISFDPGNQLQKIGYYAFSYLRSLFSLNIPSGIKTIGEYAFAYSKFDNLHFDEATTNVELSTYAFVGATIADLKLPASLLDGWYRIILYYSTIGHLSFSPSFVGKEFASGSFLYSTIKSIALPSSIVTIKVGTFKDTKLESITFAPDSELKTIEIEAFYGHMLTRVDLPSKLTTIGQSAFDGSTNTKVKYIVPASVLSLIKRAFGDASLVYILADADKLNLSDVASGSSAKFFVKSEQFTAFSKQSGMSGKVAPEQQSLSLNGLMHSDGKTYQYKTGQLIVPFEEIAFNSISIKAGDGDPQSLDSTLAYPVGQYTVSGETVFGKKVSRQVVILDKPVAMATIGTMNGDGPDFSGAQEFVLQNGAFVSAPLKLEFMPSFTQSVTLTRQGGSPQTIASGKVLSKNDLEGVYTLKVVDTLGQSTTISFTFRHSAPKLDGHFGAEDTAKVVKNFDVAVNTDSTIIGWTAKVYSKADNYTEIEAEFSSELHANITIAGQAGVEQMYKIVITDAAQNQSVYYVIVDNKTPTVLGVQEGKTHLDPTIEVYDLGGIKSATLTNTTTSDVFVLTGDTRLDASFANGDYTLEVLDAVDNNTTVKFVLDNTPVVKYRDLEGNLLEMQDGLQVNFTKLDFEISNCQHAVILLEGEQIFSDHRFLEGRHNLSIVGDAGVVLNFVLYVDITPPQIVGIEDGAHLYEGSVTFEDNFDSILPSNIESVQLINADTLEPIQSIDPAQLFHLPTNSGNYVIEATDRFGNTTTVTFVIDRVAPVIQGAEHQAYYNTNRSITFLDASDIQSVKLNNEDANLGGFVLSAEGEYTLEVKDILDNSTTIRFFIDRTAPVVNGLQNGQHIREQEISFSDNFMNTITNIKLLDKDRNVVNDGIPSNAAFNLQGSDGEYTFVLTDKAGNVREVNFVINTQDPIILGGVNGAYYNTDVVVSFSSISRITSATLDGQSMPTTGFTVTEEGRHIVVVQDEAGNSTTSEFFIDKTKPEIFGILQDAHVLGGTLTFADNFDSVVGAGIESILLTHLGTQDTVSYPIAQLELPQQSGFYVLVVTDKAGNSTSVGFVIDLDAPTIGGVVDQAHYATSKTVTFTDVSTIASITVNGAQVVLASALNIATEGQNTVVVVDQLGNQATMVFFIDYTLPTIVGITHNQHVTGATLEFLDNLDNLSGDNLVLVELTNTTTNTVTSLNPLESFTLPLVSASYTLKLVDKAGNVRQISFVVDNDAPIIAGGPINGTYIKENVTLKFSDASTIATVLLNGNTASTSQVNIQTEGFHTIVVTDILGNVAELSFYLDRTAPTVAGISEGSKVYSGTISFADNLDTPQNPGQNIVSIKLTNNDTGNVILDIDPLRIFTLPTQSGAYTLELEDRAGNKRIINFFVDQIAPQINGVVEGGYYGGEVTISFVDSSGVSFVSLNGTTSSVLGFKVNKEGKHVIIARDVLGNESTLTFYIDLSAPVIVSPQVGTYDTVEFDFTDTIGVQSAQIFKTDGSFVANVVDGQSFRMQGSFVLVVTDHVGLSTETLFAIRKSDLYVDVVYNLGDGIYIGSDVEVVLYESNFDTQYFRYRTAASQDDIEQEDWTYLVDAAASVSDALSITFIAEGFYEVQAFDGVALIEESFTIDKTPPKIESSAESTDQHLDTGSYEWYYKAVEIKITDNSGYAYASIYLNQEYHDEFSPYTGSPPFTKEKLVLDENSPNGYYTIVAYDLAGTTNEVSFWLKNQPPTVEGIAEGEVVHNPTILVDSTILKSIKLNGMSIANGTMLDFNYADGEYQLVVEDALGNTNTVSFVLANTPIVKYVDTNGNKIDFAQDIWLNVSSLELEISQCDNALVRIDNAVVSSFPANVANGKHTLFVIGKAGVPVIYTFYVDRSSPTISGVAHGAVYAQGNYITISSASDAYLNNVAGASIASAILLNTSTGEQAQITDFLLEYKLPNVSGIYTLTITNLAGNTTAITFRISTLAPIVHGAQNESFYNADVTLSFESQFATIQSVTHNGTTANLNGFVASEEGEHRVVVVDTAGNMTEIVFFIDKTAPTVTLPQSNASYENSLVLDFADDVALKSAQLFDGTNYVDVTSGQTITAVGDYTLILEDLAGNTVSIAFSIWADFTPPQGTLHGVEDGGVVRGTAYLTWQNSSYVVTVSHNGQEPVPYKNGTRLDAHGTYKLVMTSTAGMVTEYNFTLDNLVEYDINVVNGGIINDVVIILNKERLIINLRKDGSTVIYEFGEEIVEDGSYVAVLSDFNGNSVTLAFTIITKVQSSFTYDAPDGFVITQLTRDGTEVALPASTVHVVLTHDSVYVFYVGNAITGESFYFSITIDTVKPQLVFEGFKGQNVVKKSVTLKASSKEISSIVVTRDGKQVEASLGDTLRDAGYYVIVVTDTRGNQMTYEFEIDKDFSPIAYSSGAAGGLLLVVGAIFAGARRRKKSLELI